MKLYLCKKCNKVIDRENLQQKLTECGRDCELVLKPPASAGIKKVMVGIFWMLLTIVLIVAGIRLGKASFDYVADMRQIERVPRTAIYAALPGEINLTGKATRLDSQLTSPKTGTGCFYYRYTIEEERRSGKSTHWVTVHDETYVVDFLLDDGTGHLPVRRAGPIKYTVPSSYCRTEGKLRYTEYRIDPGDGLFIFGFVREHGGTDEVCFTEDGDYSPLISKRSETEERVGIGWYSIWTCWFGLVSLAFAVTFTARMLRIHHTLLSMTILSIVVFADLSYLGLQMIKSELNAGLARLVKHESNAREVFREQFTAIGYRWDGSWDSLGVLDVNRQKGLSQAAVDRLSRIRLDLAAATERVRKQRNAIPERWIAAIMRIPERPAFPLSDTEQQALRELESRFELAHTSPITSWIIAGLCALCGVGTLMVGLNRIRIKRYIENLPVSRTAGVAYGLNALNGVAELPDGADPLTGPLTNLPCVQYRYVVEEKRGSGRNQRWVTIVDENRRIPFLCTDREGSIWVLPEGAKIISEQTTRSCEGDYRYTEERIEQGDPVYVLGECELEPSSGDSLCVAKPSWKKYPYLISNYSEDEVMLQLASLGMTLLTISFAAVVLAVLVMFGMSAAFSATDYLAAAMVGPCFMSLVLLAFKYNDIVFLQERASRNWSNIDVSLQKRHDLITGMETIVRAYMAHEAVVLKDVTDLRTAYGSGRAENVEQVGRLITAEHTFVENFLAVYERYPNLMADKQAAFLSRSLVLLENEVAMMRKGYNDAVEYYNTRISVIPDVIFAVMFGFREKPFLTADTAIIKVPPHVQLAWEQEQIGNARQRADAARSGIQASATAPPPIQLLARTEKDGVVPAPAPRRDSALSADARATVYVVLAAATEEKLRDGELKLIAKNDAAAKPVMDDLTRKCLALGDDLQRIKLAEAKLPALREMSLEDYRSFRDMILRLINFDDTIRLLEYAVGRIIMDPLDESFGMAHNRPERYQNLSLLIAETSLVLSRIAYAEEKPDETAKQAFELGASMLDHIPVSDFIMRPLEECTIAAFDSALEDIACSTHMVRMNVLYACTKAVEMNNDYSYDQALLLMAIAEVLKLKRPEWL